MARRRRYPLARRAWRHDVAPLEADGMAPRATQACAAVVGQQPSPVSSAFETAIE
jgi:hypothetical protein